MAAAPDNSSEHRRIVGLRIHFVAFALVMLAAFVVAFVVDPGAVVWLVLPLVGWGSVLALHVAWVMGLLDILRPRGRDRHDGGRGA